jgi:hypothetical protein
VWQPGKDNYADYWTKHHPAKHHQHIRREFITPLIVLEMLDLTNNTSHNLLQPQPRALVFISIFALL